MIKIYNQQRQPVAIVENAYNIGYEKRLNELWSASFSLPLNDPKNEHCLPLNYVEVIDNEEYIGLFRIVPARTRKLATVNEVQYELEHVLSTLLDDVLFQYHQRTNLTTRQNIEYILSQQTAKHWKLGQCDFTRYFHYSWENENGLLGPLFSISQPFDEQFEWTFDTQSYPWTLNLVRPTNNIACEIRFGKNLVEIEREIDAENIVNRIFPLGAGEGVNQLSINKINGGRPYLENTASITKYGLKSYVWVDRRFTDMESLKASAQAFLNEWSIPKVTYRVKAADISSLTGASIDELRMGKVVRVIDPDVGTFDARIVNEAKADITGAPGDIELEIANKNEDLGSTLADIERKQQINEVYAQGATNIDSREFNDNADATHPAVIRFYLPEDVVNINQMLLSWECKNFRAHSRSTKGGGSYVKGSTVQSKSTAAGGGVVKSSGAGGGTTATSSAGGGQTTSAGGGQTTSAGGGTTTTTSSKSFSQLAVASGVPESPNYENHTHSVQISGDHFSHNHSLTLGNHTHTVSAHTHSVSDHTHTVKLDPHTHEINLSPHSHNFEVEIPAINIPDHTHEIEFGIYELDELPTSVSITVNGRAVPATSTSGDNLDIIPYLADSDGMIQRGRWVEITIKPNKLARINASVTSRLFIRSQIGGTY